VVTFLDNRVAVVRRTPQGKAVVVHLDRDGRPIGHTTEAWPDELYGVDWRHGGIERLPLQGAPLNPAPDSQTSTPARRSSARNSITTW
jgi:hypothetical protein